MTTERERIEKLLADGKVSAKEAERLLAALDRAEREDVQATARPGREIARPRLSRLAIAGAVALPAALGLFVTAFGFGVALGTNEELAAAGGLMVAAVALAAGSIVSVSAALAVRRSPDTLRGRRLAHIGIVLSLILMAAAAVGSQATYRAGRWREKREPEEKDIRALWSRTEYRIKKIWQSQDDESMYPLAALGRLLEDVEPAFAGELHADFIGDIARRLNPPPAEGEPERAAAPADDKFKGTIAGDEMGLILGLLEKGEIDLRLDDVTVSRDLASGEMVVRLLGKTEMRVVVPVVKIGAKWYFARGELRFPDGRPEAPPAEATDAVEPEGDTQ
ncbi:MAG: hypothetical protein ACYTKD_15530 [Planctomycetota bacterium]|jgi:hypothetical protein